MAQANYLTNHFLIAMPAMQDPNFSRGVTYICQHTAEGAMGLMVNRLTNLTLSDLLAQMQMSTVSERIANMPIYLGGPVQPERGFVLHSPSGEWSSSFTINDDLTVTTSRDVIAAIADGKGPERAIIALGYAGWGAGQLEQEMLDNAWLTVRADTGLIFDVPLEQRWDAAARLVGVNPSFLSDYAGHA